MDNRLKQDFTRRLSQCNKGELILIMYDIVFAYMEDAKREQESGSHEDFKTAIHKAQASLDALIDGLDFSYDISKELYRLYHYSKNQLARALYENRPDGIRDAEKVLKRLYSSFCEAAKTDTSAPIMRNTQQVYAGLTYGRTSLNENYTNDNHRGFLA